MRRVLALAAAIDGLNRRVAWLARWSVLLMLGLGAWNVVGRYAGLALGRNLSSNALIEAQWYLFSVVFLLGMGWTLERNGHVRVDVLQGGWPPRRRARLELWGSLLLLLPFSLLMLGLSLGPALSSWRLAEASPDPEGLPRYLVKALIPLGFLLLSLQGAAEAIKAWAACRGENAGPPGRAG